MPKINLLEKNIAEMIAAGEVIEKPASVIKEIIENSIDAGAKTIIVEIKNGGISYMRVTDDGCGISHEDLPLAFCRHATSKVSLAEDLNSIMTLGFRGEALASIAAVARVNMLTKQAENNLGSSYEISGGEEISHETAGCPDGSTIIIKDLFYNTPARLKFLKKDVSEANAVASMVDKLALANPQVSFKLIRDNKSVRFTPGDGKYYSAIRAVFGKQFAVSLIPIDFKQGPVKVSGYVSSPLFGRANRSMQTFFVNGRYIRSTTCMAALEEAFRNSLMVGKFPACVMNIEVSPEDIDVNVHPAKTEVRFANDKAIFDVIYYGTKNAILNADNTRTVSLNPIKPVQNNSEPAFNNKIDNSAEPAIYKTTEVLSADNDNIYKNHIAKNSVLNSTANTYTANGFYNSGRPDNSDIEQIKIADTTRDKSIPPEGITVFQGKASELNDGVSSFEDIPLPEAPQELLHKRKKEAGDSEPEIVDCFKYLKKSSFVKEEKPAKVSEMPEKTEEQKPIKIIGEIFKTYIVCQRGEEMILMDKHAAHERIRFEKLKKELVQHSQLLAQPNKVKLTPEEYSALESFSESLSDIGMEVVFKDDFTADITEMPTMLDTADGETIILKTADILLKGNNNTKGAIFDEILHSIACKSAIKAHDDTSTIELEVLANQVYNDKEIRYCPHGRPIMIKLSRYEIEKYFKRV